MSPELFARREREMREEFPWMFDHPGLLPGEVWVIDQLVEGACANAMVWSAQGVPARVGKEPVLKPHKLGSGETRVLDYRPLFVNLRALIEAVEKIQNDKSVP